MEGLNVLSLFDGMSCGQLALKQARIPVKNYFASEIDKYAIKVARANFPNTMHLGDVRGVLKFWRDNKFPKIDLLLGGSPCQGFSYAGKQLNFEDPRSKLFFNFVEILNELKPKHFLLENVKMKKESQDIISKYLGVEPVEINSSLVSAQHRKRLYWTNIPFNKNFEDKGIMLCDILENGTSHKAMTNNGKAHCLTARYQGAVYWNSIERNQRTMVLIDNPKTSKDGLKKIGMASDINGHDILKRVYSVEGKSPTLNACMGGNTEPKIGIGALRGRKKANETKYNQQYEMRFDDKSNALTSVQSDNHLILQETDKYSWRKLTPVECERLQNVPDNYTNYVSKTQRYRMLGNGWTIGIIKQIIEGVKCT